MVVSPAGNSARSKAALVQEHEVIIRDTVSPALASPASPLEIPQYGIRRSQLHWRCSAQARLQIAHPKSDAHIATSKPRHSHSPCPEGPIAVHSSVPAALRIPVNSSTPAKAVRRPGERPLALVTILAFILKCDSQWTSQKLRRHLVRVEHLSDCLQVPGTNVGIKVVGLTRQASLFDYRLKAIKVIWRRGYRSNSQFGVERQPCVLKQHKLGNGIRVKRHATPRRGW